jgi:NAD(P)-dependent dehydrogenase (short-subunit alcohol dehydrogenase family)
VDGEQAGRFDGRIALVTGAGSGIGAAVARRLAAQGAEVFAVDVDGPAAEAVAKEMPRAEPLTVDVAEPEQVDRAFDQVVRQHGRLDVVVHAAGVDDPAAKEWIAEALVADRPPEVTGRLGDDAWRRVMRVNLDGTFHVLRAALRVMAPHRSGAVVTVGSSSAFDAQAGYPHYAASKAGAHALSQSVAKEAETGMAARTPAALRRGFADPRVRPYATPEEIADIALFLASEEAANLVGAVLLANGGRFTV